MIEMAGKRFGEWVVLGPAPHDEGKPPRWQCRCSCGYETSVIGYNLRCGESTRCRNCSRKIVNAYMREHNPNVTHGLADTPIYRCWQNMKDRCTNPHNNKWRFYGGRGISVCRRWLDSFQHFYDDMGKEYEPTLQIERKNNNGNYTPS